MVRVVALKDSRVMNLPGRHSRELIGADAGAQCTTLRLVEIAPEKPGETRRGPHVHYDFEEAIHVLKGEGMTRTDAGEFHVAAGDTILVPPGERHATYNIGENTLVLLCFFPVSDIRAGTREFASWDESEGGKDA